LLEDLDEAGSAVQLRLGGGIQIAAELREGRELSILGKVQAERTSHLPHCLDLSGATHARDGVADVDGRPDALMEQVRLEKNLTVCYRDHVGRDVCGEVTGLGFNNRQCRQRSPAQLVAHLRRALEET
jgi:hypothetical protein